MSIRFQCECGKVLMASDDQAGLEGKCPACGETITVPQAEILETEKPEERFSAEQFDEEETREEAPGEIKGLEALERGLGEEAADHREKRNWIRSPRFVMLASVLVVVLVALVVFMVVRKEREPREELVMIEKVQPLVRTEEETSAPPVGARLEEEAPPQPQEVEPVGSATTEGEAIEELPTESPADVKTEAVTEEKEQEVVAITPVETPPAKKTPPIGSYTINVASFREKQRAVRYVENLKKMGIDAFDWEIDLPKKGRWYRVSVGGFPTRQEAENYANDLRQKGIPDTFITRIPGAS